MILTSTAMLALIAATLSSAYAMNKEEYVEQCADTGIAEEYCACVADALEETTGFDGIDTENLDKQQELAEKTQACTQYMM